jgi:hypothetical protein
MTESIEGMQVLHDTKANLVSTSTVLKEGEFFHETDTDRVRIGDGTTQGKNRPVMLDSNHEAYIAGVDHKYEGKDLSTVHATEIASGKTRNNTSFTAGDVWGWIKKRIADNDFDGIHVGDYIPAALSAGTITDGDTSYSISAKTLNMQIAGIDTYYGYGDTAVGHHIDFISKQCIGTNIPYNKTNHNNGTSTYQNPFMASKIYACLNGINNAGTGYDSTAYGYNASSGGILQLLPSALQSAIIGKRMYAESRYSASGHLTGASGAAWVTMGGLWLPTEQEVYGMPICSGGVKEANSGVDRGLAGSPVQYPLFAGTAGRTNNKIKYNADRVPWWLSSVASGSSTHACLVYAAGYAAATECTYTDRSVPVCFRIG